MKKRFMEWGARCFVIIGSLSLFIPDPQLQVDESNIIADYAIGAGLGLRDFLIESAQAILFLIEHPIRSTQEMVHAAINFEETYASVKSVIVDTIQKYPDMLVVEKARLHSRVLFESLYMGGLLALPSVSLSKFGGAKNAMASLSQRATKALPKNWQGPVGFAEWFAYDRQATGR